MTVKQKQCLLAYLGYYKGAVDGIWGQCTKEATEALQAASDLTVDGDFGDATLAAAKNAVANDLFCEAPTDTDVSNSGTFWDHVRYWSREEFRCRCGNYHTPYCSGYPVEPDQTLVELVDDIRAHFGRPAHPTSGIRCRQHNADQPNAAPNSKHLYGKALDFWIEGVSGEELRDYALSDPRTNYCYVVSGNVVHVDVA